MAPPRLSALEVASGSIFGADPDAPGLPDPRPDTSPVEALEQAILPALERPPCLVSFSGGRDSSAILGVSQRLADRERLPRPIPVTFRFPGYAETDEAEWQELVVQALQVADWQRLEIDNELGFLGPVARAGLRRHGLLYTPNVHFFVPLLERAGEGSVLTGLGGDEVLGRWTGARLAGVIGGRLRPRPRDALSAGRFAMPVGLRSRWIRRRWNPPQLPWLRPHAKAAVDDAFAFQYATEPLRWSRWVGWLAARRELHVIQANAALLAADTDAILRHPFLDRGFLSVLARAGSRGRYATRTMAMQELTGDVLPPSVLSRSSKAIFTRPSWGPEAREFAVSWSGEGLPRELLDPEELRRTWLTEPPNAATGTPLQAAWIAHGAPEIEVPDGARSGRA